MEDQETKIADSKISITYIILAHNNPLQLVRLVKALANNNSKFVIHIDKRAPINLFKDLFTEIDLRTIIFASTRYESSWGSFELIRATLHCMKIVIKHLPGTDRVVLMSGQDYPIKNTRFIENYLKANPEAIYMEYFKIPCKKWNGGGIPRFPQFDRVSEMVDIYGGSQWMSFPKKTINIIFDFLNANADFKKYFTFVSVPDESFFQTLLLNCGLKEVRDNIVNRSLHLVKWDYPFMHPRDLTLDNFKLIKRSRFLFARKFIYKNPSEIFDKIDTELLLFKKEKLDLKFNPRTANIQPKQCLLFLTNKTDQRIIDTYLDLKDKTFNFAEAYFVFHSKRGKTPKAIANLDPFIFRDTIYDTLDFSGISKKLVPGSNHFPLFQFYRKYPACKYYWYVEDDVRFNGGWDLFFKTIEAADLDADFLTSHIRDYQDEPYWHWWETLKHNAGQNIPLCRRIRSFNPIFRISNRAVSYLNEAFSSGWTGHHEVSLPSLLHHAGFKINDFGGNGKYVAKGFEEKFYESATHTDNGWIDTGTMRFRPIIKITEQTRQLLYHPVKIEK